MSIRRAFVSIALCFLVSTGIYLMVPLEAQTNTITLSAKLTIKAGKEKEFEALMKDVVAKVRQEPGNKAYTMCRLKNNPRVFVFFEEYADQAAVQAHGQHLKELGINFSEYLDGPVVAEYYDKIAY